MFAHPEDAPSDFVLVFYFHLRPVVVIDLMNIATGYFPSNIHTTINIVYFIKVTLLEKKILPFFVK
jgi:hypothetical protein